MHNGWRSPVSCFGFLAVQILEVSALAQDTPDDIKQILLDAEQLKDERQSAQKTLSQ
jgi:hypothetical protein